ncbi:MAG TPA: hypothetical protein PK899_07765, partial [Spirochaetota bacterium]|nr:hypothetical protein [Spirochaetota bacterium]
ITIPQNDGDVMFPQSVATGEASDDDGLGYIYWFIGKTSINFGGGAGEPTSDYASWGSYAGSNASAGRIDLTANNPKAYSWQLTTPKGTGDYKIHILPVDMNGVAASAKTVKSFTQKSLDKPVLKIDGPDPKNTYNGNVTLTFSMNAGEGKILDRIYIKIENDNTVDLVIPGSVGLINGYTYTFDITKYVDANNHDVSISAYCSNTESDKEYSAVATLNLKADNWAPTVVISGPAANSGLNGSAIISGTAQDDWSGVKTLYFGYFKTPPADLTPDYNTVSKLDAKASADIGAVNGINVFWHKVGFTQAAWSYGYNTNKITTTIHNDYKLYVAAVDAMGNVGWSSAIYDINQDLDKPGARILAPTEGSSTFPRSVASGDATDDDGLDYIYYYIGKSNVDPGVYTSWGDVSTDDAKSGRIDLSATAPTVATWKIDQTPGDTGEFTIHIVPVDKFGTAGIKRTLTYTQNTSSTPQVQIVSPNPSINNKGDIVVSIRATAGGEFKVAAIKYDLSSDIKSDFDEVTILDPGTWGAVVDYSLPAFDSTLFTNNAVHDIIVDVWCVNSNGDESQKTRTYLKADNVAPANSITNPAEGEGMNGIWPVYGSISDDWSGVDALYFSYYKGAEPASSTYDTLAKIEAKASENLSEVDGTTKIWHKVDFTQAAWSYDFDTEIITSGAKSYKLIVASVDKVGNVGWVSRTYNIDQELDYPHSKIIIPLANGNTFPQSVVSAEASDDDGVAKVFWRIKLGDPEGIGDPDLTTGWGTSDPTNDMSGIIDVDGSPRSYPFQLNTPKGDGKFTIYTQTYDVNGKLQKVATTRTYYQYASNDPHIQVKSPTNLSQTFTGAMKVVVRASGGANYNVNSLKYRITSDKPFDSGLKDATITVGNIVDATIDINTATYTSASVHDIKVEIYCVNEKGVSSSVTTLNLKADNTAPTTLNISSPDAGSGLNGLAVISGAVQDDWSGIDALYLGYFASMTDAIMNSTYNTKAKLDAAVADKTLGKWSKVSAPTAAWSYSFDTTKITSTQANPYNLYVAAVDKVGNVKYTSRSFFIDQDLDIPGSCVNIPTAADITFPGSTANGEATDDDGLARLHYYIG